MPRFRAQYSEQERRAFGNLLRRLMIEKGLSGAELARRANRYLGQSGKQMDRSTVSWYLNGRSAPTPVYANALAKALDVDMQMLLPRDHSQRKDEVAGTIPSSGPDKDVRMSLLPGGQMHLMLNLQLPAAKGWKILQLLQDEQDTPQPQRK